MLKLLLLVFVLGLLSMVESEEIVRRKKSLLSVAKASLERG
nr:venom polypeptide precursor [Doratifera vulnerans]